MRQQTHMTHCMTGCIQCLEFNRFADTNDITRSNRDIDPGDVRTCMSQQPGASSSNHGLITPRVIAVFMGV